MKKLFADADYLIALLNPQDQLHKTARDVSQAMGDFRTVTSEMVLTEVLALCAKSGPKPREAAADAALSLAGNPNSTVIPQTSLLFRDALSLYRQRADKAWSLTDCASFIIMDEQDIAEALTYDHHFEQAGFKALLRSPD